MKLFEKLSQASSSIADTLLSDSSAQRSHWTDNGETLPRFPTEMTDEEVYDVENAVPRLAGKLGIKGYKKY